VPGLATPFTSPSVRLLVPSDADLASRTMLDDENIWEQIRLLLPWEQPTEKQERDKVKKELVMKREAPAPKDDDPTLSLTSRPSP